MRKDIKRKRDLWSQIHLNCYPVIYSYIYRITFKYTSNSNKDDAQEIYHNTFILFIEKFDQLWGNKGMEEMESYKSWLLVSARYKVMEYYRKSANIQIDNNNEGMQFIHAPSSMDLSLSVEGLIILNNAINKVFKDKNVDVKSRIIFELVYFFNFSYRNIATLMGLTRSKVTSRFGKIRDQLRIELKKEGISEPGELLGNSSITTTNIYHKVNMEILFFENIDGFINLEHIDKTLFILVNVLQVGFNKIAELFEVGVEDVKARYWIIRGMIIDSLKDNGMDKTDIFFDQMDDYGNIAQQYEKKEFIMK